MSIKYIVNVTRLDLPSVSASLTLYTTSHLLLPTSLSTQQHVHGMSGFVFSFFPPLCFNINRVLQSLGILELKGKEDL